MVYRACNFYSKYQKKNKNFWKYSKERKLYFKMRLFYLMRAARTPQNVNTVPFKAVLPMKIRNHVSGKSDRQKLAPCIQELTVLFAKLKEHEFNDELCAKEVTVLREANREYLTTRRITKHTRNEGILTPGKDLHYKLLNKYLKWYPNPK